MTDSDTYLACPFCGDSCILSKPGKVHCPMCYSRYEIDDRLECMFASTDDLKLPKSGTVCALCGLIQAGDNQNCLYCGLLIGTTVH